MSHISQGATKILLKVCIEVPLLLGAALEFHYRLISHFHPRAEMPLRILSHIYHPYSLKKTFYSLDRRSQDGNTKKNHWKNKLAKNRCYAVNLTHTF